MESKRLFSPELNLPSSQQPDVPLETAPVEPEIRMFYISPLIRLTLLSLYIALTIPLPFLSQVAGSGISPYLLGVGIGLGGIALYAVLCERVVLDGETIQVTYPSWVPHFFRRGWSLSWTEIKALKPRSTGQGGLVYYVLSHSGQAYLLPMRVAGFARLVRQIEAFTGIDTTDVRPLSQPWMYFILLGFTVMLLAVDGWAIWTVMTQSI